MLIERDGPVRMPLLCVSAINYFVSRLNKISTTPTNIEFSKKKVIFNLGNLQITEEKHEYLTRL